MDTLSPVRGLRPVRAERFLSGLGICYSRESAAWRYNRRDHLQTMIPRFVHSAALTNPMPYRILAAGRGTRINTNLLERANVHNRVSNFDAGLKIRAAQIGPSERGARQSCTL